MSRSYFEGTLVRLRPMEPEDLDLLYEVENDERAWSVSASRTHFSRFSLRQYLAGQPADAFQAGELRLVIADGKEAVGLIDLTNFSPMDGRAEVCIVICPAHRGKGYARAALGLLENYARQFLRIRMLPKGKFRSSETIRRFSKAIFFSCIQYLTAFPLRVV